MRKLRLQTSRLIALAMVGLFTAQSVLADKPAGVGGGRGGKHERGDHSRHEREWHEDKWDREGHDDHDRHDREGERRRYFDARHRTIIEGYYAEQFRLGYCPPGLAKKHNGCLPPGQAKKWAIGRPLPPDVRYYDLPATVVMQLGMPPAGYRYVRVANDILLMSVGTRMILDAITDLGGM